MYSIENKTANFFWNSDTIIEEVINQSAIHTANMDNEIFELCALSTDDNVFFESALTDAFSNLTTLFIKSANIINDSIYINTLKGGELRSGFSIKLVGDSNGNILVNPTRLMIADIKCGHYITTSILLEWAKANNLKSFIDIFKEAQFEAFNEIKKNLFHMRISLYGKSYTFTSIT